MVLAPDAGTWEGSYIAANGSALFFGGRFWYWYQAGPRGAPRVGLAVSASSDAGRAWRKQPKPVLEPGPYMSWDERAVADPWVLRSEPYFYLYYLGQDRAGRQRLGVARSREGIRWEKLRSNPVLELGDAGAFDENGLGEPAVWNSEGFYWMLYTGRDRSENRRMGLARSLDGVHWRKQPAVFGGGAAWDSKVMCDASVLVEDGTVRVWFGGGDTASAGREPERPDRLRGPAAGPTLQPGAERIGAGLDFEDGGAGFSTQELHAFGAGNRIPRFGDGSGILAGTQTVAVVLAGIVTSRMKAPPSRFHEEIIAP